MVFDFLDGLPDLRKLDSDDDMMGSSDRSPALERYRLARAKTEELNLLERQDQLIDRAELHEVFAGMAGLFRGCGEALQRQYGPDALELLNETLEDVRTILSSKIDGGTPPMSDKKA